MKMLIKVSVSKANFVSEKLNRHNLLEDLNETCITTTYGLLGWSMCKLGNCILKNAGIYPPNIS